MRATLPAFVPALALLAALTAPQAARASFSGLPPVVQDKALAMVEACQRAGGFPGDPMMAIERVDLEDDGRLDVILDQNRFDCRGAQSMHCPAIGCETFVFLNRRWGGWKQALSLVGSYCIEYGARPPRFVSIQRNYSFNGGSEILNVRYRFRRGMYFQDGRGSC